ncbi:MAG: DUF2442 domain-containing protein [Terracidiphilus sp.]
MVPIDKYEAANRRGRRRALSTPNAMSARYDRQRGQIVIRLSNHMEIAFSPRDAQGLERATAAQLSPIEISPSGFGLHFPKIDADLYLPAILNGLLGSKKWIAKRLGAAGGQSKSEAKKAAAKRNGRLGGRPRNGSAAA